MINTLDKLSQMKQNGFTLDFGETFNYAFENYKKTALMAGVVNLIFLIIIFMLYAFIFALIFGLGDFTAIMTGITNNSNSPIFLIGTFLINILLAGIVAPFTAGMYKMNFNAAIGQEVSIGNAFDFYKGKYFKNIFISAIYIATFIFAIQTASRLIFISDMKEFAINPFSKIWYILFIYLFYILTYLFTTISIPFIIFGNLEPIDAIKSSCYIVFKKFWIILILLFIANVFAFMGIIAFCIGIFFTVPFVFSMVYSIYANTVGVENISEIDQIGIE